MNLKERKELLKKNADRIHFGYHCNRDGCRNCPLRYPGGDSCVMPWQDLIEEVWAETHGYVKKEEVQAYEKGKNYIRPDLSVSKDGLIIDPCKAIQIVPDQINPDHYKAGELQTIEQMMIIMGPQKVANFCEGNAFKYHARAGLKGDALTDHKKADWYMRLYEILEGFGLMDGEKAMEALREFLEKEKEKEA